MSMIGDFGFCGKDSYNSLVNAVSNSQMDTVEEWVRKICGELENSVPEMKEPPCSGEVFLALFQYFSTEHRIDLRENADMKKLGESWREITGDYDIAVFTEKEKAELLSLAEGIDFEQISQYVSDFFQRDYGTAGQAACHFLFENLKKLEGTCVLFWRLY